MTCGKSRELFAEALYAELPDAQMAAFNAHLATCASCSGEFEGLKRTIDVMNRRTRVEPTGREWEEFSKRLEERLELPAAGIEPVSTPPAKTRTRIIPWLPAIRPAWGYGVAAILLVGFGIYMGRTLFNGVSPGPVTGDGQESAPTTAETGRTPGSAESGEGAEVNRDALAYLERSRNLLLGLTNMSDKQLGAVDLDRSRKVSRELYNRGNTLTVALNRPSQQQLRQLVQGLQIILLQLANMEDGSGAPVVELVRKGVDSKSILLKINLEAIRQALAEDTFRPAANGDKNSL